MLLALALVFAAQEPSPPSASSEAPPATPPADAVAPVDVAPAPPSPSSTSTSTGGSQFFDAGQPGHYLQWYGAEYVAIVAAGTLQILGTFNEIEPLPASIGPSVSLTSPDTSLIFDARLDDVIGKPLLQEKVPNAALAVILASTVVVDAGVDLAVRQDLHRTHAILVGASEAVLGASVITEAMKLSFGRLRPDFRERWVRAACGGLVTKPDDLDCSITDDGFVVERKDLLDGMKSFPSGHASTSWAAATFIIMQVGSTHLWGSSADRAEWFQPIAGLIVGSVAAGAGYVTMTRLSDHRHHFEDVAVGAGVGVASGMAAYLIHFDLDGNARHRGSRRPDTLTVLPMTFEGGGTGALVLGRF